MLIYIFLIVIMLLLGIIMKPNSNKKNKKFYIFIVYGMLILVGALRNYTVGTDTAQYTSSYKIIKYISFSEYSKLRFEFGFFALCKILNYISESPQILLIITSFIIYGTIGWFVYRNSQDIVMSSILFVTLNYYGIYLSAMRQAIAIALVLISLKYLYQRKYVRYVLGVIAASLFHQTAIIMLILILFRNMKFKTKYLYIIIGVAALSFCFANKLFELVAKVFAIYESYSKSGFFESNYFAALLNSLVSLVVLVTGILCGYLSQNEDYSLNAFVMSISFIFYVISMKISIFSRATIYFSIFTILWLPNTVSTIKNSKQRVLIKYCILIFSLMYWIVIAKYRPEWHGVVPYKTFF